jgi:hypothetical protein
MLFIVNHIYKLSLYLTGNTLQLLKYTKQLILLKGRYRMLMWENTKGLNQLFVKETVF